MRRTLFLLLIAFGGFFSNARAQEPRVVLFETFTNSCDMCPLGNELDAEFKTTLNSSLGAKVIHLNHHCVNVCDHLVMPQALDELIRLSGVKLQPYPLFCGAVDHTIFSFTGTRITGATPTAHNEWDPRIEERAAVTPAVKIRLIDAKVDKVGQVGFWRLVATVEVTSLEDITDPVNVFFATTQDNVFFPQCPNEKPAGPTMHNDVVRYINVTGQPLDLNGKPAGTTARATYQQDISQDPSLAIKLQDLKMIAFVEKGTQTTYEVVQAGLMRQNFDTLAAPPKALTLSSVTLNGITYHPEDNIVIVYDKTNIDSVKIEFSSDNGSTWSDIGHSRKSPFFWTAPDISATQCMIRVSDLATGDPMAQQVGTFAIRNKDYDIKIIHPVGSDTAWIGKTFTIEWTKTGVESVDIQYSSNGGKTWAIIGVGKTGTTAPWFVPGPQTEQAYIKIFSVLPTLDTLATSSDPFHVLQGITGGVMMRTENADFDVSVYPQPARRDGKLGMDITSKKTTSVIVSLYDITGKEVLNLPRTEVANGKSHIDMLIGGLASGSYLLEIRDEHGERVVRQVEIL